MSKTTPQSEDRLKAIDDFQQTVDIDHAEERLTHWFQSAVESDEGADKEDVHFFLSLLKLFKWMRRS